LSFSTPAQAAGRELAANGDAGALKLSGDIHMAISRWAVLSAVTAALAMGQDLAVENASVSTSATVGVSSSDAARPITAKQRAQWAVSNTLGPQAIIGEAFSAGLGTWRDKPTEFGSHWDGFGKRASADLSEAAVSHTMEAGLGAIWGEDPRYFRDAGAPFKNRLAHVFVMTFVARNRDGNLMPAYARFIAIPSSSALANTWRPESERSVGNVGARIGLGVLGRMGADAYTEFWPDVRQLIFRRKPAPAGFANSQQH
jgi:hypothetical protein